MATAIHLLGRPRIERDGVDGDRPRGRKAWAILAYVASAERPVSRDRLAGLLFGEANDPLGALRWSLAEARRIVGIDGCLSGDALSLDLPADATVDVQVLARASWVEAITLAGLGANLLDGMSFPANPAFDAWLSGERHHLAARSAGVLRQATLARLASVDIAGAVKAARLLVSLEPLDEGSHTLMVRALVASGDRVAAEAHAESSVTLLTRELGRSPTEAIVAELDTVSFSVRPTGGAAVRALLDAGVAAVGAGATDVGLARLREAAATSHNAADHEAEIRALYELGYALVHSVRGRDEAGAGALLQAIALAEATDHPTLAASAHRELGYIDFLGARYEEALRHLSDAERLMDPGGVDEAAVAAIRGACLTEVADYPAADRELAFATAAARDTNSSRWLVWSQTMTARTHLLRGEADPARSALVEAIAISQQIGWTSVLPWPEALLAEVGVVDGRLDVASEYALHAFALGCELRDPCWEETAGRALSLIAVAEGRVDDAVSILIDARTRGSRVPDAWRFAHAQVLDALAALGPNRPDHALRWITDLELVAGRGGMRELLARAQHHRAALGQRGAHDAALSLAEGIENPALTRLLTR
jgi:DNA-binding SARP family transcriptional activator